VLSTNNANPVVFALYGNFTSNCFCRRLTVLYCGTVMRNWPYAWSLGNGADSKVKGKIGV
jgi:hypothetical protein